MALKKDTRKQTPRTVAGRYGERSGGLPLDLYDLGGVQASISILKLVFDILALGECFETFGLYRGEMNEDIGTTGLLLNEAIPLRVVEPLHCASHVPSETVSPFLFCAGLSHPV